MARTLSGPARPPVRWLLGITLLTLLVSGTGGLLPSAQAATITVTTFEDQFDDAAPCSLREAVVSANSDTAIGGCVAGSGADTIVLGAGEYHLRLSSNGDKGLQMEAGIILEPHDNEAIGDLDVVGDTTIIGAGSSRTAIDGAWTDDSDRILELGPLENGAFLPRADSTEEQSAQQGPTLVLENLTVQDGDTGDDGGGILAAQGHLITRNVVVDHNTASDGAGGGLAVYEATADLFNTTLIRNLSEHGGAIVNDGTLNMVGGAVGSFDGIRDRWPDRNATNGGDGGGIANYGTANLSQVSLIGNLAFDGDGGAIWNLGTMSVERSLLHSNHAQIDGGGYYESSPTTLTMTNVTISGNTADGDGGGGYNEFGDVELTNVTVAFNRADDNNDDRGDGGGVVEAEVSETTTLRNTIIANNVDKTIEGDQYHDCAGPMTSLGNNLVMNTDGCSGLVGSDLTGVDPQLGGLADNGGPTLTHTLQPASPAIDRAGSAPAVDQRGVPRPYGPAPDIGAYERFLCFKQAVTSVGTDAGEVIDVRGDPPKDIVLALGGDDRILSGPGADRVCAGAGNDVVNAGTGRDRIAGEQGNDTLRGAGNPDLVKGGAGNDALVGGGGLRGKGDTCNGGRGNDQARGCERESNVP